MEGEETELLSNLLKAAHRSRHVLFIQQREGRQNVQREPLQGANKDAYRPGQHTQRRGLHCPGVVSWVEQQRLSHIRIIHLLQSFQFISRFDPSPVSGPSGGLTLMLDANTHRITASSIADYAQAKI